MSSKVGEKEGAAFRLLRTAMGMNQTAAAAAVGTYQVAVSKFEGGRTSCVPGTRSLTDVIDPELLTTQELRMAFDQLKAAGASGRLTGTPLPGTAPRKKKEPKKVTGDKVLLPLPSKKLAPKTRLLFEQLSLATSSDMALMTDEQFFMFMERFYG